MLCKQVLEIGDGVCYATPVYEGYVIAEATMRLDLAGYDSFHPTFTYLPLSINLSICCVCVCSLCLSVGLCMSVCLSVLSVCLCLSLMCVGLSDSLHGTPQARFDGLFDEDYDRARLLLHHHRRTRDCSRHEGELSASFSCFCYTLLLLMLFLCSFLFCSRSLFWLSVFLFLLLWSTLLKPKKTKRIFVTAGETLLRR
jgi:hypothetical protein